MSVADLKRDTSSDANTDTLNWGVKAVRSVLAEGGHSFSLPFARTLGFGQSIRLVSASFGDVELEWDAEAPLDSMDGIIQGGMLSVIADFAQAHCFSTILDAPQGFSTVDFNTRFLRPVPSGQTYRVHSKLVDRARKTAVFETVFKRADGKPTTYVVGSWQLTDREFKVKQG